MVEHGVRAGHTLAKWVPIDSLVIGINWGSPHFLERQALLFFLISPTIGTRGATVAPV